MDITSQKQGGYLPFQSFDQIPTEIENAILGAGLTPNGEEALTGTCTSNLTAIVGVGTSFLTEINVGDLIYLQSGATESRVVLEVTDDENLIIDNGFTVEFSAKACNRADTTQLIEAIRLLAEIKLPMQYSRGGVTTKSDVTKIDATLIKARSDDNTTDIEADALTAEDLTDDANWAGGTAPMLNQYTSLGAIYSAVDYSYDFNGTSDLISFPLGATSLSNDDFNYYFEADFDVIGVSDIGITGLASDTEECLGFSLTLAENKTAIALSSNGTSFDIGVEFGTKIDWTTDTKYQFRLNFEGTEWTLDWSDDGKAYDDVTKTWTNDITITTTLQLFNPTERTFYLGGEIYSGDSFLDGKIYTPNTALIVGGVDILKAQAMTLESSSIRLWADDNGGSPRQVFDNDAGSNLIDAGKATTSSTFNTDSSGEIIEDSIINYQFIKGSEISPAPVYSDPTDRAWETIHTATEEIFVSVVAVLSEGVQGYFKIDGNIVSNTSYTGGSGAKGFVLFQGFIKKGSTFQATNGAKKFFNSYPQI